MRVRKEQGHRHLMVHEFLGLASQENTLELFRRLYDESLSPPKSNLKLAFYLDLKKERKNIRVFCNFYCVGYLC